MTSKFHVIVVDPINCNGCRMCEIVCSLGHNGECNPQKSRIRVKRREEDGVVIAVPAVCQQCTDPPCRRGCPTGAIVESKGPSRNRVLREECNGCGMCVDACPLGAVGVIHVCEDANVSLACDLCQGKPKCVSICPSGSLSYKGWHGADETQGVETMSAALKAKGFTV